jgi:predicted acetyltransferase
MTVEPIPQSGKTRVRQMLDEYLAELSAFGEVNPQYPYFECYWREPDERWPYFIRRDGSTVGFAFVRRMEDGRFSMAEFYVAASARGQGAALEAAVELIGGRPGGWELTIFERNLPAQRFWPKAIAAAGATNVERTRERGEIVYRFLVPARDAGG